jgi:ankyrin repeat protein
MALRYILMLLFQTPLIYAAFNGRGDAVEILLQNGANINDKDVSIHSFGETDD